MAFVGPMQFDNMPLGSSGTAYNIVKNLHFSMLEILFINNENFLMGLFMNFSWFLLEGVTI